MTLKLFLRYVYCTVLVRQNIRNTVSPTSISTTDTIPAQTFLSPGLPSSLVFLDVSKSLRPPTMEREDAKWRKPRAISEWTCVPCPLHPIIERICCMQRKIPREDRIEDIARISSSVVTISDIESVLLDTSCEADGDLQLKHVFVSFYENIVNLELNSLQSQSSVLSHSPFLLRFPKQWRPTFPKAVWWQSGWLWDVAGARASGDVSILPNSARMN